MFKKEQNEEDIDEALNIFRGFMNTVLHNCMVNYYKEVASNKAIDIDKVEYLTYIQNFNENEIYDLKILSKKEQILLDQLYNQGLSYKEIAEITTEKTETIRKRRNRAVKKLKERLRYYGEY